MSKVLVLNYKNSGNRSGGVRIRTSRESELNSRVLAMGKKETPKLESQSRKGSANIGLIGAAFFIIIFVVFAGAFYLFQVNDLATKGYEIRDLENKIQALEKDNKKMQIREVELTSMYAIEKATENLELVNSNNISYVEMKGAVAMK